MNSLRLIVEPIIQLINKKANAKEVTELCAQKANSEDVYTKEQTYAKEELSTVATSGEYNDLLNRPVVPSGKSIAARGKNDIRIGETVRVVRSEERYPYLTTSFSDAEKLANDATSCVINAISFSPNGKWFVAGGAYQGGAKIYSLKDNSISFVKILPSDREGNISNDIINAMQFSPDGTLLLVSSGNRGSLKVYTVSDESIEYETEINLEPQSSTSAFCYAEIITFSKDGRRVFIGGTIKNNIQMFSIDGTTLTHIANISSGSPTGIAVDSLTEYVMVTTRGPEDRIRLYSLANDEVTFLAGVSRPNTSIPSQVVFSSNLKLFAVGTGAAVVLYAIENEQAVIKTILNLKEISYVWDIKFSPDEKYLIICGNPNGECYAEYWKIGINECEYMLSIKKPIDNYCRGALTAFSPDGEVAVIGSNGEKPYINVYNFENLDAYLATNVDNKSLNYSVGIAAQNISQNTIGIIYEQALVDNSKILYSDRPMSLSEAEQKQARENIGMFDTRVLLTDAVNGYKYVVCMENGNLVTYCTTSSIEVTTMPAKTEYVVGDTFDPTGMVVTAIAQDGSARVITNYTYSTETIAEDQSTIEISYIESGITHTISVPITVKPFTDVLIDFEYTDNGDGTYTITGWKGTYNGEPSTEMIIPNYENIIV